MDGAILPEERLKNRKLLQLYLYEIYLLVCVCVYIPMGRVKYDLINLYQLGKSQSKLMGKTEL